MPDLPQTKEELDRYIEDAIRTALDGYLPSEQTLESLHAGIEKAAAEAMRKDALP
jgi:DNA-binding NarL/FixJ family response regulator